MKITCPKCKARLTLPDEKLRPEGTRFKCGKCETSLFLKRKGKKAPQDSSAQQMPLSLSPSAQEPESPSQSTVPVSESKQMDKEGLPITDRTDSGSIPPTDKAADSRMIVEKKERPGKIEVGPEGSAQYSAPVTEGGQKVFPRKALLAGAAAGILVLIFAALFFFYSQDKPTEDHVHAAGRDKGPATSPAAVSGKGSLPTGSSQGDTPAIEQTPGGAIAQQPSSAITEERAIEVVKRSEALLRNTSVESIVNKWAEENASKFKVVGWQAKKKDEQKYLVSFTAMDGDTQKGFYFEVDVPSGTVRNLAQNPELQKK